MARKGLSFDWDTLAEEAFGEDTANEGFGILGADDSEDTDSE